MESLLLDKLSLPDTRNLRQRHPVAIQDAINFLQQTADFELLTETDSDRESQANIPETLYI